MHLRGHARARTGAGGEDEVGDPDLSFERCAVEGLSVLGSELASRDCAVIGEVGSVAAACGREEKRCGKEKDRQPSRDFGMPREADPGVGRRPGGLPHKNLHATRSSSIRPYSIGKYRMEANNTWRA